MTALQPKTRLTPRHYQLDGIDYLTTKNVKVGPLDLLDQCCRHILADAPGAGKTFQASEAALSLSRATTSTREGSVLVIAPAHLCKQWYEFLCEQYDYLGHNVVWLEGTRAIKTFEATQPAKWYIVSVQSLRQHEFMEPLLTKLLTRQHINVCIVDESHYCKNPDAIQAKVVRKLTRPEVCKHVILLTATPIVREANDLYMQLRICDPHNFNQYLKFLQTYCWFSMTSWGAIDVTLKRGAMDELQRWLWGRSYQDIGLELPPVISSVHAHPLSTAKRKAYDDVRDYWRTELTLPTADPSHVAFNANSAMEVMHMLRHLTSEGDKMQSLTQYLQDDPGPFLIATFYRAHAAELAGYIRQHSSEYNVTVITGETDATIRPQLAKAQSGPKDIVIATIPSLSEGCDLSHCNSVYFYEEDWTPGKHYQFLSRVRRHRNAPVDPQTGQSLGYGITITEDNHLHIDENPNDRPVIVRYFHAKETIDTRIHMVLDHRAVSARDIVKVELGI